MPRVWEKFEAALRGKLAEATGIKAKLASWARETELEAFKKESKTGQTGDEPLKRNLANKLVISKIKEALGLDQLLDRDQWSGAYLGVDARVLRVYRSCRFMRATG